MSDDAKYMVTIEYNSSKNVTTIQIAIAGTKELDDTFTAQLSSVLDNSLAEKQPECDPNYYLRKFYENNGMKCCKEWRE